MLWILLLALLLTGTQGCRTIPKEIPESSDSIVLPGVPERPELPEVVDLRTAALQISLLMTYAKEWEVWGMDVRKIVGEE